MAMGLIFHALCGIFSLYAIRYIYYYIPKPMSGITTFFEESKLELKKTSWPTREETVRFTIFIIVFSFVLGLFLGALDFVFLRALEIAVGT